MNDLSLRNDILDYWREATEGHQTWDPRVIAEAAMLHFKRDQSFCDRFLDAFLLPVVRDIGRDFAQKQRAAARSNVPSPMPRSIAVKSSPAPLMPMPIQRSQPTIESVPLLVDVALVVEPAPSSDRWRRWQEVDPETGQRISLFRMTKRQLLNAADERAKASMSSQRDEALLRLMAGPLKEDDDVAESYWGTRTRQLDTLYSDIEVERTRFHLRSLMQGAAD